jgi:V8-like Glu-specific endopeptidase
MRPHQSFHKYDVSKRDNDLSAFSVIFFALLAVTLFSLKSKADDPSKTEAAGICIDCVIDSLTPKLVPGNQFGDIKAIKVAIFSADPGGATFVDPREVMDRSGSNNQLNAIGLITVSATSPTDQKIKSDGHDVAIKTGTKLTGTGTGFLINDCLVLTNQHVPSLENNADKFKDLSISFAVGAPSSDGHSKFLLQSPGQVIAQGHYSENIHEINQDWAIIKLDKPLGKTVGSIPVIIEGSIEQAEQLPVSSASFYLDKTDGSQLWGQKRCSLFRDFTSADQMVTDCPSIPGASGSPIFVQDPRTKKIYAIGLIEGGLYNGKLTAPVSGSNANSVVPLFKAFSKSQLDEIKQKYSCDTIST